MSVYIRENKNGTKVWVGCYYPNGRKGGKTQPTLGDVSTMTREQAEKMLAGIIERAKAAQVTPAVISTVSQLFKKYMEDKYELDYRPNSIKDVWAVFNNHIDRILGKIRVENLVTADITHYKKIRKSEFKIIKIKYPEKHKDYRPQPVSNRTINKELNYFSGFITWVKKKYDFELKGLEITELPETKKVPRILTFEETVALLNAAEPYYRALFGCLYIIGLRLNETRQLTWNDLDLNAAVMFLADRKGNEQQYMPIPAILVEFLKAIQKPEGYVFESLKPSLKGQPFRSIAKALQRTAERAGIKKHVYPHLLRHTFATHMVLLNEDIKKVSALMGHGQVSTTEIYTHIAAAFLKQSGNKLNDALAAMMSKKDTQQNP
jgi:integrase/recombinase XerD